MSGGTCRITGRTRLEESREIKSLNRSFETNYIETQLQVSLELRGKREKVVLELGDSLRNSGQNQIWNEFLDSPGEDTVNGKQVTFFETTELNIDCKVSSENFRAHSTTEDAGIGRTGSKREESTRQSHASNNGVYWGVQRILGLARSVCRWIWNWKQVCTAVVSSGSGAVSRSKGFGVTVVVVKNLSALFFMLWPSSCFNDIGLHRFSVFTGTKMVCLLATPFLVNSRGIFQQVVGLGLESAQSLLECFGRLSYSSSQLLCNSSQLFSLLSNTCAKQASPLPDLIGAADFSFTAAAFLHLVISSAVRWCKGLGATHIYDETPQELKELGYAANVVYEQQRPATVTFRGEELELLSGFSDREMAVYVSPHLSCGNKPPPSGGGLVLLCHRGTWSPKDLVDDLHILCGTFRSSARYRSACSRLTALLRLWPDCRYVNVGHSLGGTVSMAVAAWMPKHLSVEAHALNPGVSFEGFVSSRSTIHLIDRDFVGCFAPAHPGANCKLYPAHKGVKYLPLFWHPHSISNFS